MDEVDIYFATNNPKKVKEGNELLQGTQVLALMRSAKDLGGMPAVEETEPTFEGNARLKAQALQRLAPEGSWILADDSGLCVDALKGEPGIYTARYAGENATDEQNYMKLIEALEGYEGEDRAARFICCLVLLLPEIGEVVFQSSIKGYISKEPVGEHGFGYDPVFKPVGFDITTAQMLPEQKAKVSHRARAFFQLNDWLNWYFCNR